MSQRRNSKLQPAHVMRGMSLPEILAAVLIGLIGMVVIMQVYATSEERKRTTTGTSDAQINGNIAMFTMESTIRSAGFGMVAATNNMLGCTTRTFTADRLGGTDRTFLMAPVVITVGAGTSTSGVGGAPDQITVIYGSSPNVVQCNAFVSGAVSDADFPLKNAAGIWEGDLVVAHEALSECSLAEVTGFLPASVNTVQHASGATYTYVDSTSHTITSVAKHNKAGGSGVDYSAGAMLYTLGRSPTVVTFQIGNDKLQTRTLFPYIPAQDLDADGTSDSDIGDGIVQLKALYGKDTSVPSDGKVDVWNNVLPLNETAWMQVRAVRIALLARSAQFEKTAVTADCDPADPPAPPLPPPAPQNPAYWSGGCFAMTNLDGTPDSGLGSLGPNNFRNYRYRIYETVVPLRNMIWSN